MRLECCLIAFVSVAIIFSPHVASAECLPAVVAVFYGNGIRTTPDEAEADRTFIQDWLNEALSEDSQAPCTMTVRPAYNNTESDVEDLVEAARQLQTPVGRIL